MLLFARGGGAGVEQRVQSDGYASRSAPSPARRSGSKSRARAGAAQQSDTRGADGRPIDPRKYLSFLGPCVRHPLVPVEPSIPSETKQPQASEAAGRANATPYPSPSSSSWPPTPPSRGHQVSIVNLHMSSPHYIRQPPFLLRVRIEFIPCFVPGQKMISLIFTAQPHLHHITSGAKGLAAVGRRAPAAELMHLRKRHPAIARPGVS